MDKEIIKEYQRWLKTIKDDDLSKELVEYKEDSNKIEDAFYKNLEFGTGGLRGVIGAGTNRMNVYVVKKASQGLANYISKTFKNNKSIAISYDSRHKSDVFAKAAAEVFASNGIKVFIYKELMPTPCLSFAVRELNCSGGIMITASHNPAKYNGYKVYGNDGCQITSKAAKTILEEINSLDIFEDINSNSFDTLYSKGMIEYIEDGIYTKFINRVKEESLLSSEKINKDAKIVYSPLHGTGLKPVTRILKESGYNNIIVVKEQELPDGNFTTCPYPNPEIAEAMELGIKYAKRNNADLLIATDPDCDRVGIAVKNVENNYTLLSGNQVGVLLLDYICKMRIKHNKMPANPVFIKTIVTTDMAAKVADFYGVKHIDVLTGFKYIGEQILLLENENRKDDYILGFEESYGYLSGSYVRDKDGVDGVFLIVEMFSYYKTQGISLLSKLNDLYKQFGHYSNYLKSYEFPGLNGFNKMNEIMESFRTKVHKIGDYEISELLDYSNGLNGLPKSNVIKMKLKDGSSIVIRPSGTEPKIKIYISIQGNSDSENSIKKDKMIKYIEKFL